MKAIFSPGRLQTAPPSDLQEAHPPLRRVWIASAAMLGLTGLLVLLVGWILLKGASELHPNAAPSGGSPGVLASPLRPVHASPVDAGMGSRGLPREWIWQRESIRFEGMYSSQPRESIRFEQMYRSQPRPAPAP